MLIISIHRCGSPGQFETCGKVQWSRDLSVRY